MDKAKKLEKAQQLIDEGRAQIGKTGQTSDAGFIKWQADVDSFLHHAGSLRAKELKSVTYHLPITSRSTPDGAHQRAFDMGVQRAVALLESARTDIEEYEEEPRDDPPAHDVVRVVLDLCRRFPRAARRLETANRHAGRPGLVQSDEYDVQDALHAFLLLRFDDVRPEEWTPSYAGSSARMDFLLPDERLVIEVKRTREKLGAKQAKEELAVDIDHYRMHEKCGTLVCFVYDPDHRISNPVGFEKDLEGQRTDALEVRVVVAPQG